MSKNDSSPKRHKDKRRARESEAESKYHKSKRQVIEITDEDVLRSKVKELTQEVHDLQTRLIKEKQENLKLNTSIKSHKELLHDLKTSMKAHSTTEDSLRSCIRAIHRHMKGTLRKLEDEFQNERLEDPVTNIKFHQMELLNELLEFLDTKLNAKLPEESSKHVEKRSYNDYDQSPRSTCESYMRIKTEGQLTDQAAKRQSASPDFPQGLHSYQLNSSIYIKPEPIGDQSTSPIEAGEPTPRLYIGGLGAVSKDGTFICRLVGQIAKPVDIRCGVRGFAFVTFSNCDNAYNVMEHLTKNYPKLHVNFTPMVDDPECAPSATLWIGNINIALPGDTTIYNAVKESGEFCVTALKSTNGSGLPYAFANFKSVESCTRTRVYLKHHYPLLKIRYWDSVPEFVGKYLEKVPQGGKREQLCEE